MSGRFPSLALLVLLALPIASACGKAEKDPPATKPADPVIVEFAATPESAIAGEAIRLSWTVEGADSLRLIDGDADLPLPADPLPSGWVEVRPDSTRVYILEARRGERRAEAQVQVEIVPPATAQLLASAEVVDFGQASTLSWNAPGSTSVRLAAGATVLVEEGEPSGSIEVNPERETTYLLLEGESEVLASVTVRVRPVIDLFEVVTGGPVAAGSPVELRWRIHGAEEVVVSNLDDDTFAVPAEDREEGSTTLPAGTRGAFRVEATLDSETVWRETTIGIAREPAVRSLTVTPSRVTLLPGDTTRVRVAWETEEATSIRLVAEPGGPVVVVGLPLAAGSVEVDIGGTTNFELTATNSLGSATATTEVIAFGPESIVSFEANRDEVAPGETVGLSWRTTGGASLFVRGPGGPLPGCATEDPATILEGGCTFTAPSSDGRHAYELVLTDGAGTEAIREAAVTVRSGPRILSFASTAERGCGGDEVTLSWSVTRDAAGVAPTLRLEDDRGDVISLDGLDPQEGEVLVELEGVGNRTFTLVASTPEHDEAERSVDVEVFAVPEVSLEAAEATYDPGALEPLELSWTATGASELVVFLVDGDGGSAIPIHAASAGELAAGAGSLLSTPSRPTTFRAIARSAGGCEAIDETSVSIAALEILDFSAVPDEILAGDFSTLSWSVVGAERVEVAGVPAWERIWEPFIDISQSPSALPVPQDDCDAMWFDDGCALVTFPNFVFPFDGVDRTEARIYVNGVISFDTVRTGDNMNNFDIPSTTGAWAHLAPFWDDLGYLTYDVMYDVGSDDRGRFLVVQWLWANYSVDSNLEFEVILRESGEFEFRYGDMSDDVDYERAIGRKAVIGYQNSAGTDGALISSWEPVWDLPYSGFAFRAPQPGGYGSALVQPWATEEFVLTAHGHDGSTATASATVTVHQRPDLMAVVTRQDVELGDVYELRWSASGLTGLVISDDDGPVHVAGPGELAGGSLPLVASALGTRTFTLQAAGALGSTADATAQVTVWVPFDLDSFEVTPAEIAPGQLATVSWASHGAETLELRVNGSVLPTTGMDLDAGAVVVGPDYTSTYEITLGRADGRSRTMSRKLRVVRASLDDASVPAATRIALGGTVPVSWSVSSPSGNPVSAVVFPAAMRELDPLDAPFEDISATGTELTDLVDVWGVRQMVQLPAGFVFPFLGEGQTAIQVGSSGYLGFDPTTVHPDWRTEMPAGRNGVHIAPFWEDLRGYANGRVYVEHLVDAAGERYIVQWTNFEYVEWPSGPGADLNFQVVLFPDGSFEFRYGAMVSNSWQGRADGEVAIIGYQDVSGRFGYTLVDRAPMVGGLSNRTWRFDGSHPPAGTAQARPGRDGRIRVCAVVFGDLDCEVLTVDVVSPGDLAITELQLAPSGGLLRQWFEIRNTSPRNILLDGMEIRAGSKSHLITPASPLVLAPGEYATLAASSSPGFTPDYVYGVAIDMDPVAGILEMELDGVRIAAVEWDATWPVTADVAIEVDGFALRPVELRRTFTNPSVWCPATQSYDGASLGTPGFGGEGCLSTVYWADHFSNAPFLDISATGVQVPGTTGTWGGVPVPGGLPFSFPFYGAGDRTDLWVGSTGEVGFTGSCDPIIGCWVEREEGVIFAFRDFLVGQPGSSVRSDVRSIGGRQVRIIQWTGFGLPDSDGSLTFQVQLWEGGEFVIAYAELEGDPAYQGGRAFVGLQSIGYMDQLLYSDTAPVLWSGQSILYRHR
ncbi:MAG TPA: hypothetical protein VGD74_12725 [Vulgatibacter sp.]